jgi:murein DD-endopeptidase MepM/ murein hydrolase activator NlpD
MVGLPAFLFGTQNAAEAACANLPAALPEISGSSAGSGVGNWDAAQVANAGAIVATGRQMGISPRGQVIALGTAMQESVLYVYANSTVPESLRLPHQRVGSDTDSVGLFQQRPSMGWGSVAELMNPSYSARKFYEALKRVEGWEQMRLTDAAQAVQRSGYPEAYQKWEDDAETLAAHLLGVPNIDQLGGGNPLAPCGSDAFGPVIVGPGGWVQPVRAPVGSGFRTSSRPGHDGVDLSAGRNIPIRAASDGRVERMICQSGSGTCDRDGGIGVGGCGWYVDIRHANNIVTRYCHMVRQPEVVVGQAVPAGHVLGFVGSSGNSSGPHLHYEVHVNVPPGAGNAGESNAVDPVAFMRAAGATLGE